MSIAEACMTRAWLQAMSSLHQTLPGRVEESSPGRVEESSDCSSE